MSSREAMARSTHRPGVARLVGSSVGGSCGGDSAGGDVPGSGEPGEDSPPGGEGCSDGLCVPLVREVSLIGIRDGVVDGFARADSLGVGLTLPLGSGPRADGPLPGGD